MATAHCLNEDCEKPPWTLTKPPSEYAGDGPTCPLCGTTRVDIEFDGDGQQRQQRQQTDHSRQQQAHGQGGQRQQQQAQTPARGGGQSHGGGVPAAQQPESAGDAIARTLLASGEDASPEQKAEAAKSIGGVVVDTASRFIKYKSEVRKRKQQHAKDAEIQKVEDKPRCVECGFVFSELPIGQDRVTCPDCGEEYEIRA